MIILALDLVFDGILIFILSFLNNNLRLKVLKLMTFGGFVSPLKKKYNIDVEDIEKCHNQTN